MPKFTTDRGDAKCYSIMVISKKNRLRSKVLSLFCFHQRDSPKYTNQRAYYVKKSFQPTNDVSVLTKNTVIVRIDLNSVLK